MPTPESYTRSQERQQSQFDAHAECRSKTKVGQQAPSIAVRNSCCVSPDFGDPAIGMDEVRHVEEKEAADKGESRDQHTPHSSISRPSVEPPPGKERSADSRHQDSSDICLCGRGGCGKYPRQSRVLPSPRFLSATHEEVKAEAGKHGYQRVRDGVVGGCNLLEGECH